MRWQPNFSNSGILQDVSTLAFLGIADPLGDPLPHQGQVILEYFWLAGAGGHSRVL